MGNPGKIRTKYPMALKRCIPEAFTYGTCVSSSIDVKFKECEKEFRSLNKCFQNALKQIK